MFPSRDGCNHSLATARRGRIGRCALTAADFPQFWENQYPVEPDQYYSELTESWHRPPFQARQRSRCLENGQHGKCGRQDVEPYCRVERAAMGGRRHAANFKLINSLAQRNLGRPDSVDRIGGLSRNSRRRVSELRVILRYSYRLLSFGNRVFPYLTIPKQEVGVHT